MGAHRKDFAVGVDGWWSDEGDPLDIPSRLARNRTRWEGPQLDRPNEHQYALHRDGYAGMQRETRGGKGRTAIITSRVQLVDSKQAGMAELADAADFQISAPRQDRLLADTASLHTPTMTLKNAALLALIGTILATILLVWTFVTTVLNVLRGLAPPVMLFSWFVYAFACFSMAVFFYVFHRAQS